MRLTGACLCGSSLSGGNTAFFLRMAVFLRAFALSANLDSLSFISAGYAINIAAFSSALNLRLWQ